MGCRLVFVRTLTLPKILYRSFTPSRIPPFTVSLSQVHFYVFFSVVFGICSILRVLLTLFFIGLLRLFFNIPVLNALYPAAGAILFSFYLAYHTRLIVSGKSNKYKMNEKDYILGAMTLYLDVINLFVRLLDIFARSSTGNNTDRNENK
jgi:FtsH-binding integral membrane protein